MENMREVKKIHENDAQYKNKNKEYKFDFKTSNQRIIPFENKLSSLLGHTNTKYRVMVQSSQIHGANSDTFKILIGSLICLTY